jgi:hypothetical protein
MFQRLFAVSLGTTVGLSALLAQSPAAVEKASAGKAIRGNKRALTPETYPELHALIRPQEDEWRHLRVHWLTDVVAARRRAAAEDKPLVICYTGGAGYNEPLGVC